MRSTVSLEAPWSLSPRGGYKRRFGPTNMAATLGAASVFLGGGVSLRGVRGFGAFKSVLKSPTQAVLVDPSDVNFRGGKGSTKGWTENGPLQHENKTVSPRRRAVDLWHKAQRAREAAKGMSCFAALSTNGYAFAQLQTNAKVTELFWTANELEDLAVELWESLDEEWVDEDDGVDVPVTLLLPAVY